MLQTASSRRGSERDAGTPSLDRALRDGPIGARLACGRDRLRAPRRTAPRAGEPAPPGGWGLPPQVAADERQRVDELDEPVRKHDQQRRRMLEAVAQFLEQPGLVEVDAHPAAVLDRLFA